MRHDRMKNDPTNEIARRTRCIGTLALLVTAWLVSSSAALAAGSTCKKTAKKMQSSCRTEVGQEHQTHLANCLNLATGAERSECRREAREIRKEDGAECRDQRDARMDACELLDEDRYDTEPLTDASLEFVHPDTIGNGNAVNPFFPLEVGRTTVLRAGQNFEETVVVHVTDQTREVLGQPCRIVVDAVVLTKENAGSFEYEAIEVTDDLYAQTTNGDLYYCGETARNFEDGVLRDLEGSFEAGLAFAKSGVLIKAAPVVGDAHRQEFLLGEAEDLITYVDTAADVPLEEGGENPKYPCASQCLKTAEFIPPEPGAGEFKYYRSGIGFVLGIALEDGEPTGERDELVCVGDSLSVLEDPSCGIGDPTALIETLCKLSPDAFCVD